MVLINPKAKDKLEDLKKDNFYVVIDFDKTISTKDSNTTFSLFSKSGIYGKHYSEERDALYQYYRPQEIDPKYSDEEKCAIMEEWWKRSYGLMLKYGVRKSDVKKINERAELVDLREGAIEFICLLNEKNIPVIINSAGIGNFIIELLKKYEVYTDNIYVFSNILEFQDDVVVDSIKEMVHSMNKYNIKLPNAFYKRIENKKYAIIIGDQISDLCMADNLPKEKSLSLGFLESNVLEMEKLFNEQFDIVLKDNATFKEIGKILNLK